MAEQRAGGHAQMPIRPSSRHDMTMVMTVLALMIFILLRPTHRRSALWRHVTFHRDHTHASHVNDINSRGTLK